MSLDETWVVTKTDTSASAIESANTVFTVSNGYLSLKGNLLEYRKGAMPSTIVNGVFDLADMVAFIRPTKHERRYLDPEYFDGAEPSPSVANLPNPLFTQVIIDGKELSFTRGRISNFKQNYNLKSAVYSYSFDHESPDGKITHIEMERFAAIGKAHIAMMRYTIQPVNYSGEVIVRAGIDGRVKSNLKGDQQFDVIETSGAAGECRLTAKTRARGILAEIGISNRVVEGSETMNRAVMEDSLVYNVLAFNPKQGEKITIDRHIAIACSEDARHGVTCSIDEELGKSTDVGYEAELASHCENWARMWEQADVKIEGNNLAQLYLRFCLMHVLSAAPRYTDKLSVPCKLLTGEYYQGTTFYDTDLYIEPFYLFNFPSLAKTCINYRYFGLENGRKIASDLGYKGAKFAWQAGPYGEECLGKWWRFTHTNIHIDGDVAYSLMQYIWATGDFNFLAEKGIDILVESARFYASRSTPGPKAGTYSLVNVAGPDEGHCESTNNFYTNLLAKRTLQWTAESLEKIKAKDERIYSQVVSRLSIDKSEPQEWEAVADGLVFYFDPESKVYEQCEGFYNLLPAPPDLLANRAEWFVTVFPYQALNQPDVVMAMVMFRDQFDYETKRANWEFYKDKSMNFSSMSFVINSMMAVEMDEMDYAYEQFLISAGEDLDEELTGRKDTAQGIHGTASGGAWMAAVLGFGGVLVSEDTLYITPKLPNKWKSLSFNLIYRGFKLKVRIEGSDVEIAVTEGREGDSFNAVVGGNKVLLKTGDTFRTKTQQ